MRFRVLGGLGVDDDHGRALDLGGPKQRAVLAALLVAGGRPVSADRLQGMVWRDRPPANPETSLQAYVSNLRRVLEPDRRPRQPARVLVTRPAGYALIAAREDVDAMAFEDEAQAGRDALTAGEPTAARAALEQALARWSGPLLPELAEEPWVEAQAAYLAGVRRQALEARFDAGLALGEHRSLLPRLERAVVEHPFEEHLRFQHALALYRCGRQRDALDALAKARTTLREEVGVDPGRALRDLEQRILTQDPTLDLEASEEAQEAEPEEQDPAPARGVGGRGSAGAPHSGGGRLRRPAADKPAARPEAAQPSSLPNLRFGSETFVGREKELLALLDAAQAAGTSGGRAVVVSGEPGIGKTRLVEELVSRLPGPTVVAWGRCLEAAAGAAYWPCIQLGRQLEGAGALPTELLAELLPPDDVQAPPGEDALGDRLDLHVAVVQMLASSQHPIVLVVDDLQWADVASLRVIEFVAGKLWETNVLLVVTTRPIASDAPPALIDCLGELARLPSSLRIGLSGLSDSAVGDWLAERAGSASTPALAEAIHDRTGGNPFFVGELVELLAAEGRTADLAAVARGSGVPAAVQDVVRRRVSRLPVETQQLLSAASIVGRSFDLDVLGTVVAAPVMEVLERLDPALDAGLVVDTDLPGRFQFSHALVAETLEEEVSPTRRARLHATTAQAMSRLRGSDLEGHLAELAHHAVEGAIAGTAGEAYEWSVRAARQATARLAHEEAAAHWSRAARALDLARPGDALGRHEALLEEGLAWLRIDAVDNGYAALVGALEVAMQLGDSDRIAATAAAMSVDGVWHTGEVGLGSTSAVTSLERALEVIPEQPTVHRVLAAGALAEAAYWVRPPESLDAITAEAVAAARTIGDPVTLGRALHKRNQALWRAATLDERAQAAEELFAMTQDDGLPADLEAMARFGLAGVRWEQGDVLVAREQVAQAQRLAHALGSPALITQLDWFASTIAGFEGRLAEAESLCDDAFELYRRTRRWSAETLDAGLRTVIYMEQDRLDEIRAQRHLMLDTPYRPWFQEGHAYTLVELGELDEADEVLADAPLPPLVDSWLYTGMLAAAMHARVALRRHDAVATLIEVLAPYAGRLATAGTGPAFGDVHLALAAGHRLLGAADVARRHADASVALLRRAGAGPDLVRALLLRADLEPDAAEADRAHAAAIVDRLDLPLLRRRLS